RHTRFSRDWSSDVCSSDLDNDEQAMTVVFEDNKEVKYEFSQLDELELAYAISIHKSQGSEFPVVLIPIAWGPPMLMTRNLLYTRSEERRVGKEARYRRAVQ